MSVLSVMHRRPRTFGTGFLTSNPMACLFPHRCEADLSIVMIAEPPRFR